MQTRRMPTFEYLAPINLKEAIALLDEYKNKARVIAGGTDLLPKLKGRELSPQYLIDLKKIQGLDYIRHSNDDGLRFGARTTLHSIETSSIIMKRFDVLAQAARSMASVQIRNIGTIAGNLCNAVPSADTAPALIVLDARAKIVSSHGERTIAVEDLFLGPNKTILNDTELLAEVHVPIMPDQSSAIYLKYARRRTMDLAMVGVAAMVVSENGFCRDARIALGAVGPTPIRATGAEKVLGQKEITESLIGEAARVASEEARPISDMRASAEYRREIVRVLTKRAVRQACEKNNMRTT